MSSLNKNVSAADVDNQQAWYQAIGGAALWTSAQYGSFFVCAWWVSQWVGTERFGAFSQGLALVAMFSPAITLRFEYVGQLESRQRRARGLFWLAEKMALIWSVLLLSSLAVVRQWVDVPVWLWAGALALLPQAGVLVQASQKARQMQVVRAAALRAAPALLMVVILVVAKGADWDGVIEWSIPLSVWICWIIYYIFSAYRQRQEIRCAYVVRLAHFHARFVRAELPGFLFNVIANHGQVLLVGMFGGNTAAGIIALALRIAMLPTSVFGLALADRLRARVVVIGLTAALHSFIRQALRRTMALSLAVHIIEALVALFFLPLLFPAYDDSFLIAVMVLLPLGVIRLVASPLAFVLTWRGWLGLSLLGQCLLFVCALLSVWVGLSLAGLTGVVVFYAISAALVYSGYILMVLKAVQVGD
jgi:O-antigen/teichoic acid export membrane protein